MKKNSFVVGETAQERHERIWASIDRLAEHDLQLTLAISLHAAEDGLRDVLVPLNRRFPLEQLKEAGFWIYGFDERGEAPLMQLDLKGRVCFVLGAEGEGLRRLTAERCDRLVTIPTSAQLAALNVSNAAAVALYEWARRKA